MSQPLKALAIANQVRLRRYELRRRLRTRSADVRDILAEPPDYLSTAAVEWLLLSVPGLGMSRASRICLRVQLSPSTRIGRLTERQRRVLVESVEFVCPRIMKRVAA